MDNQEIKDRIQELVDREHELRESGNGGGEEAEDVRTELRRVEEQLDKCWDLLRQRRARQEAGENPDEATTRSVDQVESYLQ